MATSPRRASAIFSTLLRMFFHVASPPPSSQFPEITPTLTSFCREWVHSPILFQGTCATLKLQMTAMNMKTILGFVATLLLTFHTAMSTAFPQPEPRKAPKPWPMKVEPGRLRDDPGINEVNHAEGKHTLAIVNSTLA
jgi:hypothetical protein